MAKSTLAEVRTAVSLTVQDRVLRNAARAGGYKTYDAVKPCGRGHTGVRWARNSACLACEAVVKATKDADAIKAYKASWYQANKTRLRPIAAAQYAANREGRAAYNKAQRAANPEKNKERCATYRLRKLAEDPHWEKKRQPSRRRYRQANVEKFRARAAAYRAASPEQYRTYSANRMALVRGAVGKHTKEEVLDQLKKQKGKCYYCFAPLKNGRHSDHYIAVSKGGDNSIRNIVIACPSCNFQKNARHPLDFIRERFDRLL